MLDKACIASYGKTFYTPALILVSGATLRQKFIDKSVRRQAFSVLVWQVSCVLLAALFTRCLYTNQAMSMVMAGGACVIVPAALFALCFFSEMGGKYVNRILCVFYIAEIVKLLLTAFLFALCLAYFPGRAHCFLGFVVALVAFFIAPIFLKGART